MIIVKDKNALHEFVDELLEVFFDGAVNIEESGLPPGFSSSDIESVEDYVEDGGLKEEEFPGLDSTSIKKKELQPILQKKADIGGKADHETPYIHRSSFTVVDKDNRVIDLDMLKNIITKRPKNILKQNGKIKKSSKGTFVFYNLTLPAYKGLWYNEKKKEFEIVTTCPNAGACKLVCYARKGGYVQYDVAFNHAAQTLNFLLNDWQGFKAQLVKEIEQESKGWEAKGVKMVLRWHDAGDFFNEKYLQIALDIARATPNVTHYAYTKSVEMVSKANKPNNFIFNFSYGGKQDDKIEWGKNKNSVIVPGNFFKDLFPRMGATSVHRNMRTDITPEMLQTLRERLSKAYHVNPESIITYKQLMEIPYDPNTAKPTWNVIVKSGDGDDAAMRKDVISTLLFIH